MKKHLMIAVFVCVAIFVILGSLSLFEIVHIFSDSTPIFGQLFFTSLIGAIVGSMMFLPLDTIKSHKIVSIVDIVLLATTTIVYLVLVWFPQVAEADGFFRLLSLVSTINLSAFAVLSYWVRLKNKHVFWQIATYVCFFALAIIINLLVFGVDGDSLVTFLALFALLSTAGFVVLGVLANKKAKSTTLDTVTISKQEYDGLIARIKELEEKLK